MCESISRVDYLEKHQLVTHNKPRKQHRRSVIKVEFFRQKGQLPIVDDQERGPPGEDPVGSKRFHHVGLVGGERGRRIELLQVLHEKFQSLAGGGRVHCGD